MIMSNLLSPSTLKTALNATFLSAVFCLLSTNLSNAQTKEYVVFSIEGDTDNLKLGQTLNEGDRIEISNKAIVQLISKTGEVVTLEGPVAATVTNDEDDPEGEESLAKISDLLFNDNKFTEALGGTRSIGSATDIETVFDAIQKQTPWSPLISEAGSYCLASENPTIRRSQQDDELSFDLISASNAKISLVWPAGDEVLSLSGKLKANDASYIAQINDEGQQARIFVTSIGDKTIAEQAAWLAEKGCKLQALELLAKSASN